MAGEPRANELFQRALDMGPEERRAFLDRECAGDAALRAEVESLLAHHSEAGGSFLGRPAFAGPETLPTGGAGPAEQPRAIGPYRVLRLLGEGGMGQVWLAEQEEPLRRKVALKVIRPGLASDEVLARFESERQALALMDHPNIARVFDAGSTADGLPYFAMEYVEGLPIHEHCDRHRLGTHERLQLFEQVCRGVQHAHQRAVIHRDLKPGNILVSVQDGQRTPKIIDFGVAKATRKKLTERTLFTELGAIVGTPEYMSPEQAGLDEGGVDTRTDTYSLGVILYELLVGALPFEPRQLREAGFEGLCRIIREEDPPRPTQRLSSLGDRASGVAERRHTNPAALARQLRGELEWITMRALEKDPQRRYAFASDLADDVGRFLRDEPVEAAPPGLGYRLGKLARRHRLAVGAAAVVLAGLLLASAGIGYGLVRAQAEAERANQEARAANEVADFMVGLFELPDPSQSRGEEVSAREVLDRGAKDIRERLADQPAVRARLLGTMGRAYRGLGLFGEAEELGAEASREYGQALGPGADPTLLARRHWSEATMHAGDPRAALAIADSAVADAGPSTDPEVRDQLVYNRAQVLYFLRELEEARPLYEELLERYEGRERQDPRRMAALLNAYANTLRRMGEVDSAFTLYTRSHELLREHAAPDEPQRVQALINAAAIRMVQGRDEDARPIFEEALPLIDKVFGPDHMEAIGARMNFAVLHTREGDMEGAEEIFADVLARARRGLGEDHPQVARILYFVGDSRYRHDDPEGAREAIAQAVAAGEASLGPDHDWVVDSRYFLGGLHEKLGDEEEALAEYLLVLDRHEAKLADDDPTLAEDLEAVARMLRATGRGAEAPRYEARAAEVRSRAEADTTGGGG